MGFSVQSDLNRCPFTAQHLTLMKSSRCFPCNFRRAFGFVCACRSDHVATATSQCRCDLVLERRRAICFCSNLCASIGPGPQFISQAATRCVFVCVRVASASTSIDSAGAGVPDETTDPTLPGSCRWSFRNELHKALRRGISLA